MRALYHAGVRCVALIVDGAAEVTDLGYRKRITLYGLGIDKPTAPCSP